MSSDHSQAVLQTSLEAAGTLLTVSTIVTIAEIAWIWRAGNSSIVRCALGCILTWPIIGGWMGFLYMLDYTIRPGISAGMNLYRSGMLIIFLIYVTRLLGRDPVSGGYSETQLQASLVKIETVSPCFLCVGSVRFSQVEDVRRFLRTFKVSILQHSIVLLLISGVSLVLEIGSDTNRFLYGNYDYMTGWMYVSAMGTISAFISIYYLLLSGRSFSKSVDFRAIEIQGICVFFSMMTLGTELQEYAIAVFSAFIGFGNGKSAGEQTAFLHGFLMCLEMSLAAFLQILLFPIPRNPSKTQSTSILTERSLMDFSQVEMGKRSLG